MLRTERELVLHSSMNPQEKATSTCSSRKGFMATITTSPGSSWCASGMFANSCSWEITWAGWDRTGQSGMGWDKI